MPAGLATSARIALREPLGPGADLARIYRRDSYSVWSNNAIAIIARWLVHTSHSFSMLQYGSCPDVASFVVLLENVITV